jgi:hypothetical protein
MTKAIGITRTTNTAMDMRMGMNMATTNANHP